MESRRLREMADRCRELQRVATRDDIRDQLRQWAQEFDAEAAAIEAATSNRSASDRDWH